MYVTYLLGTPNVHIHYLTDDETADTQGYAETELCCHACGRYERVLYVLPPKGDPVYATLGGEGLPALREEKDAFEVAHKGCVTAVPDTILSGFVGEGNYQYRYLCPPWRKYAGPERVVDFRAHIHKEPSPDSAA